ncbi:MAG TPA: hypothetical protein VFK85_03855 [Anaeromyxobacteraceae bacterium]|nr:hypothetical protein [Anaeromyxobacteraceae bacterium]
MRLLTYILAAALLFAVAARGESAPTPPETPSGPVAVAPGR